MCGFHTTLSEDIKNYVPLGNDFMDYPAKYTAKKLDIFGVIPECVSCMSKPL